MEHGLGRWAKPVTLFAGIGLLLAVAVSPFAIAGGGDTFGDIAQTAFFQFSFVISLVATFLLTLAFVALASRHSEALGSLGAVGFIAGMLGASLLFAIAWSILAIVPTVAQVASSAIDPPPGRVFISFGAVGVLWLVFAATLWLKRLFTPAIRVLATLSAVLSIGPLLPLGMAVMGVAMLWISRQEPLSVPVMD